MGIAESKLGLAKSSCGCGYRNVGEKRGGKLTRRMN